MDINTQLAQLLYEYSSFKKIIDESFCNRAIDEIARDIKVSDYIKKINYINNSNQPSSYNLKDCILTLNLQLLYDNLNSERFIYKKMFTNDKFNEIRIDISNIFIFELILHELEHVYQNKIILNKRFTTLYDKLVQSSLFYKIEDIPSEKRSLISEIYYNNNRYNPYFYMCNPLERFAEIKSYIKLANIFSIFSDNCLIIEYLKLMKYKALLLGYYNNNSSLEHFISIQNQILNHEGIHTYNSDLNDIIIQEYKGLCPIKKAFYGLPIDENERKLLQNNINNNEVNKILIK